MLGSQVHRPKRDGRITVTLSLRRSIVKKLTRKAKEQSNDDKMASRSRVAEEILEQALQ